MEQLAMRKDTENYAHFIEVDEQGRRLVINRVYRDGSQELFTFIDFPSKSFSESKNEFRSFAQILGENLLVDSPAARAILKL
jgi:hypothetical protein